MFCAKSATGSATATSAASVARRAGPGEGTTAETSVEHGGDSPFKGVEGRGAMATAGKDVREGRQTPGASSRCVA